MAGVGDAAAGAAKGATNAFNWAGSQVTTHLQRNVAWGVGIIALAGVLQIMMTGAPLLPGVWDGVTGAVGKVATAGVDVVHTGYDVVTSADWAGVGAGLKSAGSALAPA